MRSKRCAVQNQGITLSGSLYLSDIFATYILPGICLTSNIVPTLVCFVSSPGGLGMKYKVTHTTQIDNWLQSLS